MAEILAIKTSLARHGMPGTFEAARAEALFASTLQPSESPSTDQVRHAIATALRRWGVRGCAARVAGEFGDQPDTAVARMCWARATVNRVYPAPSTPPVPRPRALAFAS
jgi:hypothetical protein